MHIEDAVQSGSGHTTVRFHITPGSSKTGFAGYDPWRKCIKVSIRSQPRIGEANAELISILAEWFGIDESKFDIVSGKKDRSKSVSIQGLSEGKVLEVLKKLQEDA
ncbi:MAG: YggU family protein [Thermoplasmata archaeon]|nr:YggU family protein [Thermoplasmata archaeon]